MDATSHLMPGASFTTPLVVVLLGWYLASSLLAFLVFAHDKRAARRHRHRVPERRLHVLELIGGFPGAWLAIMLLRHKSSKPSFLAVSLVASAVNLGLLVGLLRLSGVIDWST